MYTGLLHTHRLVVILFLLLYLVKLVLLLMGRAETLATFTKRTRIPEMIISALFLLTGVGMLFMIAEINVLHIVKILVVLAAIPVAVIGFRKANKLLATLSVLLIIGAYGLSEMNKIGVVDTEIASVVTDPAAADYDQLAHGKALYERNCVVCHGPQGMKQGSGAKNLTVSQLNDEELHTLLVKGKKTMPAYGELYTEAEITAATAYVKTLRK